MINDNIFRTYDIRGKVPGEINEQIAYKIGKAFGCFARQKGAFKIAVGMDNRNSSPMLSGSVIKGLCDAGCSVVDIGLVITPILYYALHCQDVDGGIMITGSHNPGDENGFKIALGKGTIYGEDIQCCRSL
jgi:phosphomannomutase/phosphoglucomutase